MRNLHSIRAMWLKGWLFLLIGLLSAAMLLFEDWSWRRAGLLMLCVWGFCRAYYFAFYVIEHYIDGTQKYAGLWDFVRRRLRWGDGPRNESSL